MSIPAANRNVAPTDNSPPSLKTILAENYAELALDVETIAARATAAPRAIKSADDLNSIAALVTDARALNKTVDAKRKAEKDPHLQAGREVDQFFAIFGERLERIQTFYQRIADDHARAKAAEERRRAEEEARKLREEAVRQAEIARRAEEAGRAKTAETHGARAEVAQERAELADAIAAAPAADLVRERTESGVLSTAKTEWTFEIVDLAKVPLEALRPYLKRDAIEAAIRALVKLQKDQVPLEGVRIFQDVKAVLR